MCTGNHLEAWKGVIDFSKVVLTFSSAVTVAIIGYYMTKEIPLSNTTALPIALLIASAVFSLFWVRPRDRFIENRNFEKGWSGFL
jgi:hypothetical protein